MNQYLMQTRAEQQSTLGALNLFFGALLGANLGVYAELPMKTYVMVIVFITGAVAALQVALRSERPVYAWSMVGLYTIFMAWSLQPNVWPGDARPPGYDKLLVTLAAWLTTALLVKLIPIRASAGARNNAERDQLSSGSE